MTLLPIECEHEPYTLFSLYFTNRFQVFAELAANTNKYAEGKRKPKSRAEGKKSRQQGSSVFGREARNPGHGSPLQLVSRKCGLGSRLRWAFTKNHLLLLIGQKRPEMGGVRPQFVL